MSTIEQLAETLSQYLPQEQVATVKRAYYYAEQAHDGQKRKSGEHYVTHPLAVAFILADLRMDCEGLTAALLHDVIEDTGISRESLAEQFGEGVAGLVDGVSKLTHLEFNSQLEKQAHNFQKMAMAMADDIRVIMVKLADRLHNMRTLDAMPGHKKTPHCSRNPRYLRADRQPTRYVRCQSRSRIPRFRSLLSYALAHAETRNQQALRSARKSHAKA